MSQPMVGHGEERPILGRSLASSQLDAFIESPNCLVEPAGTIKGGARVLDVIDFSCRAGPLESGLARSKKASWSVTRSGASEGPHPAI